MGDAAVHLMMQYSKSNESSSQMFVEFSHSKSIKPVSAFERVEKNETWMSTIEPWKGFREIVILNMACRIRIKQVIRF